MSRRKRQKKYKLNKLRFAIALFTILFVFTVVGVAGFAVFTFYKITQELPKLEKQADVQLSQTTKLYTANGTFLADFHAEENRVLVPLDSIPLALRQAVIAIEDERFYSHHGVDYRAILRAAVENIKKGGIAEGASTLTMQYVRMIYISREETMKRKIKEALIALKVESMYSKDKILEKYLNTNYFGSGAYGVEAASQTFFGKPVKSLTLSESALIAGIIQSPSGYSPYHNKDAAKARRNTVLTKMSQLGYITPEQAAKAAEEEVAVKPVKTAKVPAAYFVEYVRRYLSAKLGENAVFRGGLRVYTTLDLKLQNLAEQAVFGTLNLPSDPRAALVTIEPSTGYIKCMVGGRDYEQQKFNYATQGKRQTGSSFKTFTLVAAIENGISTNRTFSSSPTTIRYPGGVWKVSNYDGGSSGMVTVRQATIKSINAAFARLVMEVKPENVVKVAKAMGIKSKLDPVPSITLGSQEVTPLEMASAYGTLANDGIYTEPKCVTKITDSSGKVIFENKVKQKQAVSSISAFLTTEILEDVINYGTATRGKIGRPAAGKTGTNQEYRDAWFAGYTPNLATAVWVGFPNAQISMKNIHGFRRVTGGSIPTIIWAKFMKPAHADLEVAEFKPPEKGISRIRICVESGFRARDFCPKTTVGVFKKGTTPIKYCELHKGIPVPNIVGKTFNEASDTLIAANLAVEKLEASNPDIPLGQIFTQSPSGGTLVKEGTLVRVTVNVKNQASGETVADFSYTPKRPEEEELVSFDASSSHDPNGDIIIFEWDFGDGTTYSSSSPMAAHRFKDTGEYTVTLRVVSNNGSSNTSSAKIDID